MARRVSTCYCCKRYMSNCQPCSRKYCKDCHKIYKKYFCRTKQKSGFSMKEMRKKVKEELGELKWMGKC